MSCGGCGKPVPIPGVPVGTARRRMPLAILAEKRAMDVANSFTRHGACTFCAGPSARLCPATKVPIAVYLHGHRECFVGKHPDKEGVIRGAVDFYGLPAFQRAWLWTTQDGEGDAWAFVHRFSGCGCPKRLRDWWDALPGRLRNWWTGLLSEYGS